MTAKEFIEKEGLEYSLAEYDEGGFLGIDERLLEQKLEEYHQSKLKLLGMANVMVSLPKIRQAFAEYYASEGCSCCRNEVKHDIAEKKLGELLQVDKYKDGSGYDFYKYESNEP